jgi:radical SAM superfamily enzyme YgiQ (UPF0313 family)
MKSKSLLINYSGYPTTPNAFLPDNGLAALAGSLLSQGHQTTILDYNVLDVMRLLPQEYGERLLELKQEKKNIGELKKISELIDGIQDRDIAEKADEISGLVAEKGIDFLALKLWTGKSFENGIKLAKAIKKRRPSVPIFAGGPHVDYFRRRIYGVTDVFDVLAYGEGEETIVGLAEYVLGLRELNTIPNLVIKDGAEFRETPEKRLGDLNRSFPVYDTETYPALEGDGKLKIFISEFSRGCPFRCNFCGHSNKSGAKWRSKSAESITDEFKYIAETHGMRVFRNGDSNTPGSLISEVAEKIVLEGLDVEYVLMSHVNNMEPENLGLLKRSGCFSVFFGIESGNQNIVDNYINKGLRLDRAREIIAKCSEEGLFVVTSYVYPSPGETEESKNDTFEFIKNSKTDAASICVPIITPMSTWGDNPERYGIELSENYFDELMFFTPALFYPATLWQPLNYRINGKSFAEIATESDRFAKALEKDGVLTHVMEDAALMAKHCGMGFRDFRDKVRHYLTVGNQKRMSDIVKKINENSKVLKDKYPVH